jgi:hypothetical protein
MIRFSNLKQCKVDLRRITLRAGHEPYAIIDHRGLTQPGQFG